MKKLLLLLALGSLLTGCAAPGGAASGGDFGNNLEPARGTTGVSSGAESGPGITGSDVFAPR